MRIVRAGYAFGNMLKQYKALCSRAGGTPTQGAGRGCGDKEEASSRHVAHHHGLQLFNVFWGLHVW